MDPSTHQPFVPAPTPASIPPHMDHESKTWIKVIPIVLTGFALTLTGLTLWGHSYFKPAATITVADEASAKFIAEQSRIMEQAGADLYAQGVTIPSPEEQLIMMRKARAAYEKAHPQPAK